MWSRKVCWLAWPPSSFLSKYPENQMLAKYWSSSALPLPVLSLCLSVCHCVSVSPVSWLWVPVMACDGVPVSGRWWLAPGSLLTRSRRMNAGTRDPGTWASELRRASSSSSSSWSSSSSLWCFSSMTSNSYNHSIHYSEASSAVFNDTYSNIHSTILIFLRSWPNQETDLIL